MGRHSRVRRARRSDALLVVVAVLCGIALRAHAHFEGALLSSRTASLGGSFVAIADDPSAVAAQLWTALHGFVMLELAGYSHVTEDPENRVLWPMLGNLITALAPPAT